MLPICVHYDASKHGCDHLGAVNRTWIQLKKSRLAIRVSRFVVDNTIEDAPVRHAASRVAAAMVTKLRTHAAVNVVELFVKTLVVLQTTPILASGLEAVDIQHGVPYYRPKPISLIFCKQSLDLDRRDKQCCDTKNCNPGTLPYELYQSQKRAGAHFCFLHEASQQLFTREQRSNAICV
ncbi:hypothetical protein TNCV_2451531 [Trichonephila clavipes]|nr:hypothetical protein TNCV_2451531 [Trichonephila clavipes]